MSLDPSQRSCGRDHVACLDSIARIQVRLRLQPRHNNNYGAHGLACVGVGSREMQRAWMVLVHEARNILLCQFRVKG